MSNIQAPSFNDAAADASRLLQRLGYAVLAIGAPCAESLSTRAIFIFFPIGAALLLVAVALDPVKGGGRKLRAMLASPLAWVCLALFGWAALSLAWTPFPAEAGWRLARLAGTAMLAIVVIAFAREHMRAGDLYLFPIGIVLAMLAIMAVALAESQGLAPNDGRIGHAGVALVVMLWPAMAGLAARGRNGLARLLLIIAAAFVFAIGAPGTATALLVGVLALSFAISDVKRTVFDFSVIAAAIVVVSPLVVALAPALARALVHAKLATLHSGPFPALGAAAEILLHEPLRLFTGHGFDAAIRATESGLLPRHTPRVVLFQLWYELGVVGAVLGAAAAWLGFRAIGAMSARISPYLVAALASDLALAFLSEDFSQMWWVSLLAVSGISAAAAFHSQYRTRRPLASMAHPAL